MIKNRKSKAAYEATKLKKRAEAEKSRQLQALEDEIATAERKLAILTTEIEQVSLEQDIETLQRLGQDYQKLEEILASLFETWIETEGHSS